MLLEKDKYCCCPNCNCKSFKEIDIVNVVVMKDEWNDERLHSVIEKNRYKCIRCGEEFSVKELKEYYDKQG